MKFYRTAAGRKHLNRVSQFLQFTLFVILVMLCFSGSAMATSTYLTEFTTLYPSSTTATTASWSTSGSRCNVCHSSGGDTPVNAYGNAWAIRHNAGRTPAQAFQDIELDNSDGSAVNNSGEITANAQPGWRPGANNTLYDHFSPGTVVASNQNPPTTLIGSADPASVLPTVTIAANLPNASETGPTNGQFTVTRTGATTSALTVNYAITGTATNGADYSALLTSVTIPASSATATITVTPVNDTLVESNETVILTLSANAAYTIGSPNNATVTIADNDSAPPPTGPQIALSTAKLDFGQAQINTMATRTASVHNIGDATLEVTGITRCSGTSSEYTWSPNSFTSTPGSSHLLTVFYKPTNQSSDNGCLQIASNDTTQNPEILNLAGVGTIPSVGPVVDIDVSKFSVKEKVYLMRPKPVQIQVSVKNPGSVGGVADVTVVGIQNNVEVYNEILSVTLKPRSNKRLAFPSYTPSAKGDIVWTVTVSDADPDFDEATATTRVALGGHHGGGDDDDDDHD